MRRHIWTPVAALMAGALLVPPAGARDARDVEAALGGLLQAEGTTRGQMARDLGRALEGDAFAPPDCVPGDEMFDDVPASSLFCPAIEELARRGITSGCDGDNYCPGASLTRAQMAIFVVTALESVDEDFAPVGHDHFGQSWTGSGPVGLELVGTVPDSGGSDTDAVLFGINTYQSQADERPFGIYGEVQSGDFDPDRIPGIGAGVFGRSTATDDSAGVLGRAGTNPDLQQLSLSNAVGVAGLGDDRGVYASSFSSYGTYSTSLNWYGVYGRTNRDGGDYGIFTPDNLGVDGTIDNLSGTFTTVMRNGGDRPLEAGDVVVFTGLGDPVVEGGSPTPVVTAAGRAGDTAVAGVVLSRFDPVATHIAPDDPGALAHAGLSEAALAASPWTDVDDPVELAELDPTPEGPVPPGEYLRVVIQGPAEVKVTADAAALRPGALLGTSAVPAHAGEARGVQVEGQTLHPEGSVLGKALEAPAAGRDRIWTYVTLN